MFEWITSPEAWIALGTLTALEIVLGIDNIIFISILVGRLPAHQREFGRRVGISLAMLTRLALLFSIAWVMSPRSASRASASATACSSVRATRSSRPSVSTG